jgi:hypothetical protein
MGKTIAEIFFNHMGYPRDLEDFLLPYVIRSLVILEDTFQDDVTLLSLCRCRLRFVSFLKEKASEDMIRRGMETSVTQLEALRVSIEKKIEEIPAVMEKTPFFEDFFFAFGREDTGVKFSEENQRRYMNGELKIIHIIESQPEIIFRV